MVFQLGAVEVTEQYYVLNLGGADLTQGVDWLAKLGEVVTNWGNLTMAFRQGGEEMTIRGDPTLAREIIAPEALLKITEVETIAVIWGFRQIEVPREEGEKQGLTVEQGSETEKVLEKYQQVLQEPSRFTSRAGEGAQDSFERRGIPN